MDFDPFKTKEDVEEFSRMVEEEKARNTLKSRPSNDPARKKAAKEEEAEERALRVEEAKAKLKRAREELRQAIEIFKS